MIECPIDNPFLCKKSNKCVKSFKFCEKDKYFCGDGLSLCEDYICRESFENIDYSNSPYVVNNCVLIQKNITLFAGNYIDFILELRTEQGLLYNGDIDINNDILIEIENYYKSFNYSIIKDGIKDVYIIASNKRTIFW